jgi:hypothetical protein
MSKKLWPHCLSCKTFYPWTSRKYTVINHTSFATLTHLLTAIKPKTKNTVLIQTRMYMWQYDGASSYIVQQIIEHLSCCCGYLLIDHGGPQSWPPNSPDLSPLDRCFFLSLRIHARIGLLGENADKRWTVAKFEYYCLHTGQSWWHERGNMFHFKTNST